MTKKKQVQPSITWRVGDGPVHEIPDGAEVTFTFVDGTKKAFRLSCAQGYVVEMHPKSAKKSLKSL